MRKVRQMKPRKVFCIGFQKTGTTSLGMALDKLGYKVTGYDPFRHLAGKEDLTWGEIEALAMELAAQFDAAKDTPWPLLYRQLDEAFPGSRFIHVERDRKAWIQSAVNDFGDFPNEIHKAIYGSLSPKGNEEAWLERYDRHNAEVTAFFADRPDDFLSLDLSRSRANWEKLCSFLDEPTPDGDWPHANTRTAKKFKMKSQHILSKLGLR